MLLTLKPRLLAPVFVSIFCLEQSAYQLATRFNTVELRLSELIKTRGGSDKLIVRVIEQHAIHMKLDHIQCIKSTVQRGTWLFIVHY